jgi:predicted enzyme related to lactoylglutathione lyase
MTGNVRLNLLVLKTHHLDQLKLFYSALGLSFVEEKHGEGPSHLAAQVGNLVLELYPLSESAGPPDATTRLGFAVPDLDETVRALEAVSAVVVTQPRMTPWGRRAVVRDVDGRPVELTQG